MKRPRLLICLPQIGGGGAEMHVVRLLPHLTLSWDISVVALRGGGHYRSLIDESVSVCSCLPAWAPSSAGRAVLSVRPLERILRTFAPDLVLSLVEPAIAGMGSALSRLPAAQRPRHCAGLQNNLDMMMTHLPMTSRPWLPRLVFRAYLQANHIIALSEGAARGLQRMLPSSGARTTVIPNAGYQQETLETARKSPMARHCDERVFVACGRLTAQKDYPTLLQAFAYVADRHRSIRLEILGQGAERRRLERMTVQLGISDKVRFLGYRPDPMAHMLGAAGLLLSSRWEGFANVISEAMACGTPVVATDCPYGPSELLDNGRLGQLVPVGDSARFAYAIERLLTRPAPFLAKAEQARLEAVRYEAGAVAKRYDEALRSLIPMQSCA